MSIGVKNWLGMSLLAFLILGCDGDPKFLIDSPSGGQPPGKVQETRLGVVNGKGFILRQAVFRPLDSAETRIPLLEVVLFDRVYQNPCHENVSVEGIEVRFIVRAAPNRNQDFSIHQPVILYDDNGGRPVEVRLSSGRALLTRITEGEVQGALQVQFGGQNSLRGNFTATVCPD